MNSTMNAVNSLILQPEAGGLVQRIQQRTSRTPESGVHAMRFASFCGIPLLAALLLPASSSLARAGDEPAPWKKADAGQYLDERAKTWFAFPSAGRGEAET